MFVRGSVHTSACASVKFRRGRLVPGLMRGCELNDKGAGFSARAVGALLTEPLLQSHTYTFNFS